MKGSKITVSILIVLFAIGFITLENKKRTLGSELGKINSELFDIKNKRKNIEKTKILRSKYFITVNFLNRPYELSGSIEKLFSNLGKQAGRTVDITETILKEIQGNFEFKISGKILEKPFKYKLNEFSYFLEQSGDMTIITETETDKKNSKFTIKGEM